MRRILDFVIFLLLSGYVIAQTVTITLSLQVTANADPPYLLNLQIPQAIKSVHVSLTEDNCGDSTGSKWFCGRYLCLSVDNNQPICKEVTTQYSTFTYDINSVGQRFNFATGRMGIPGAGIQIQKNGAGLHLSTITIIPSEGSTHQYPLLGLGKSQPQKLGRVSSLLNIPPEFHGKVLVKTNDSRALAWFDDGSGTSAITRFQTPIFTDILATCINSAAARGTVYCDFEYERACSSSLKRSDWLNGYCCNDAPYTPGDRCAWYSDQNALCFKTTNDRYLWAALSDVGSVTQLTSPCPVLSVVSNGTRFYTCNQQPTQPQDMPSGLILSINGSITIENHQYICKDDSILECGGDAPYSLDGKRTGQSLNINGTQYYCTANGTWQTSLDSAGKTSCEAAGFSWSGTKCCGETNDALHTYEDPYTGQGSAGACYKNQFIPSGNTLDGTLSYRGKFIFCDPELAPNAEQSEQIAIFSGTGLVPLARGECGTPLADAKLSGTKLNALCTPAGTWTFTNNTEFHLVKSAKWTVTQGTQQGCCTEKECWDGTDCKPTGSYYTISERGFRCQ